MKHYLTLATVLTSALVAVTPAQSTDLLMGEVNCLVRNVFHEARGEPLAGQRAVMDVTLNRAKDPRWPSNVCDVVYQPYQFSWTLDVDLADSQVWYTEQSTYREIRDRVVEWLKDYEPTTDSNHYATVETNKEWMVSMRPTGQVGNHKFFVN